MSGRRSRCQHLRRFSAIHRRERSSTPPCLVEYVPYQPYLVAPGKLTVQKSPDFEMTSSQFTVPATMLAAQIERWPIAGSFTISRGAKTEAVTVVAEVQPRRPYRARRMRALSALWRDPGSDAGRPAGDAGAAARRPRPRGLAGRHARGRRPQRAGLRAAGPRGQEPAASAIWDLLGRPAPRPCITAYTISLGTPEAMAAATAKAAHRPLLKIKLGGDGDGARIAAVRKAAPESELIVDANEAWTAAQSRAESRRLRRGRRHAGGAAAPRRPG